LDLLVAALDLLRESRALAKLLTATLGTLGGEREDVLELDRRWVPTR
jgi:hypothetical protein